MRLKLFLVLLITTIGQIATVVAANAESTQLLGTKPVNRLVSQGNLASTLALTRTVTPVSEVTTATDLIARSKRKTRRAPVRRRTPIIKTPTPNTSTPPEAQTTPPVGTEKQVLVSDIIIKNPKGQLNPDLESKIRQALTVKVGQPTTRPQLEQNLNAIRSLGAFSAVEIVPEDTAKGVKLSFLVTPYGVLNQVQIRTMPASTTWPVGRQFVAKLRPIMMAAPPPRQPVKNR